MWRQYKNRQFAIGVLILIGLGVLVYLLLPLFGEDRPHYHELKSKQGVEQSWERYYENLSNGRK